MKIPFRKRWVIGLVAALVAVGGFAIAQSVYPTLTLLTGNELIQVYTLAPTNQFVTSSQLGSQAFAQAGAGNDNALVGGDFGTNLFQRGISDAVSSTSAVTYTADRWFSWIGTSTTLGVQKETGFNDITPGYEASVRIVRTGVGISQACTAQEIESVNSYRFQSTTAEFDFHAQALTGFSAALSALTVYISTGISTVNDEGSQLMAYGINTFGGGHYGWTQQANQSFTVPLSSTFARYTIAAPMPLSTTEVGVSLCWTPTGTSPSNDGFEFTGAQLVVNPTLKTAAGASGAVLAANSTAAKSVVRRSQGDETALQQRYHYQISEPISGAAIAAGVGTGNTQAYVPIPLPVTMRAAPTCSVTVGTLRMTSASLSPLQILAANGLSTLVNTANLSVTISSTAQGLSGIPTELVGNLGTGNVSCDSEL